MTDKQLVVFEGKQIKITKAEYDTFVSSITTQNPTKEEINLYLYDCDRRGVHPLDKLIYFTKRKGRYVPIIGIDYMRIRAESSGVYAGSDDAVFAEGEKYPVSATIAVYKMVEGRLGRFTATARWDEYKPEDLSASASFMWKKMPHTMLAKCAEALALRKAFPGQLAGVAGRQCRERRTSSACPE
jgi:phage recombination protein Bet